MECGRRGYTKSSAIYEVQLSKDDSYHSVIRKISRSIGIDDCEENELRLFNGRGGIIPDGCITLRDKVVDWSLGAFLKSKYIHMYLLKDNGKSLLFIPLFHFLADPSRKIPVLKRDSSTGLITPVSKGKIYL